MRPTLRSTKVLVLNGDKVLLARPNYAHRKWSLPGGAVEQGESFEEGARRELFEETSIAATHLQYIGENERFVDNTHIHSHAFLVRVSRPDFAVDGIEIKEAQWFPLDTLPSDRAPNVDRILAMYESSAST